ncbi:ccbl [Symbiodinium microadriaticum]|nr:ccbl [Symbiodinium microadriaticum]
MAAFCNPGDEIVVITPCFDAYFKSASVLGLRMKGVPLTQTSNMSSQNPSASDFTVNLDTLRSTLSQDTKLLLLNTPASPLGKVFTENELRGISELVTKEFPGLLVLSDEVYEYMTFDNKPHLHIANQPGMWERTISIFSIGKSFSCTGWRLGYAIAPSSLIHTIKTLHSVINFSATTPVQMATAKALDIAVKINYKRWLQDLLQGKRDTFCGALNAMGINFVMPEGGYFVVADMSPYYKEAGITEKSLSCLTPSTPLDDRPDVVFCKWLTREVGVAGIPMSPFYTPELRHLANNHLRFAYCKDSATLNTAVERLQKKFGQV